MAVERVGLKGHVSVMYSIKTWIKLVNTLKCVWGSWVMCPFIPDLFCFTSRLVKLLFPPLHPILPHLTSLAWKKKKFSLCYFNFSRHIEFLFFSSHAPNAVNTFLKKIKCSHYWESENISLVFGENSNHRDISYLTRSRRNVTHIICYYY